MRVHRGKTDCTRRVRFFLSWLFLNEGRRFHLRLNESGAARTDMGSGAEDFSEAHMFEVCRRLTLAALLFATFAFTSAAASAQTITGTIRGTITDPSGAVIRGAKVTATNVATAVKTTTVSDAAGEYSMQFLAVGAYTVTVTAGGFDTTS